MSLKPTHQAKFAHQPDVTAWQFSKTAFIPVWVARIMHRVGGEGWSGLSADGKIVEAKEGDWAVVVDRSVIILTDKEFQEGFKPLAS